MKKPLDSIKKETRLALLKNKAIFLFLCLFPLLLLNMAVKFFHLLLFYFFYACLLFYYLFQVFLTIYQYAQIYSEGSARNVSEKQKFLKEKFSKLIGTHEKFLSNSGFEKDRKIINIDISEPLTKKRKWKVYKIFEAGFIDKKILIYEKTDKQLDSEMKNSTSKTKKIID